MRVSLLMIVRIEIYAPLDFLQFFIKFISKIIFYFLIFNSGKLFASSWKFDWNSIQTFNWSFNDVLLFGEFPSIQFMWSEFFLIFFLLKISLKIDFYFEGSLVTNSRYVSKFEGEKKVYVICLNKLFQYSRN
jgi:hypothetical protein